MLLSAIGLFVLGLCAGSFINAVVWRVHEQAKGTKTADSKLSVLKGRSMCPRCRHELAVKDLIPLFSWLSLRGRCRYCQKPIAWQYPAVELIMGSIFAVSYLFWPLDLNQTGNLILLSMWLVVSVGLLALLVYDFRWMLLPNRILYPALAAAVIGRLIYILGYAPDKSAASLEWLLSLAVASGIFWLIFVASQGRWIGYGDVRLGLVTGTVLATPGKSFLMIFTASILGVLYVLPALISGRRKMAAKVPFGPFLITATFLVLLFGQSVLDWYLSGLS
jgi:prepilin signal peptidase PulO-like enzyme (type II secretory pathway)